MKTIELSTGTLLVVDVPKEFVNGMVVDDAMGGWLIGYSYIGKLPSSGFQLLGHPSEITGEVWGKVCERFGIAGWKNYRFESQYEELLKETPSQSAMSLLDANNIQESDVLLFKPKER